MLGYLQLIIAKGLAIVDGLMENWTTTPEEIAQGTCGVTVVNVELNACGTELTDGLFELIHRGVALLNGMVAALGAGSY